MTRFLAHVDPQILIADLKSAGFVFVDEDGIERPPMHMEIVRHGMDDCIWLGQVPITDGETTSLSAEFCANVTACVGVVFSTEIEAPDVPYNIFG